MGCAPLLLPRLRLYMMSLFARPTRIRVADDITSDSMQKCVEEFMAKRKDGDLLGLLKVLRKAALSTLAHEGFRYIYPTCLIFYEA